MDGSDRRLFEAIFQQLFRGTEEGHEEPQSR
jgi:hypothetical protein